MYRYIKHMLMRRRHGTMRLPEDDTWQYTADTVGCRSRKDTYSSGGEGNRPIQGAHDGFIFKDTANASELATTSSWRRSFCPALSVHPVSWINPNQMSHSSRHHRLGNSHERWTCWRKGEPTVDWERERCFDIYKKIVDIVLRIVVFIYRFFFASHM